MGFNSEKHMDGNETMMDLFVISPLDVIGIIKNHFSLDYK
jgi:hypothetical protein